MGRYFQIDINRTIALMIFCALAFAPLSIWALNCSLCNVTIKGRYVTIEGQALCTSCYQKNQPRCDVCNKKLTKFVQSDEKKYCSQTCFAKTLPSCSFCHQPCLKQQITFQEKLFCSQRCMDSMFKCYVCQGTLRKSRIFVNPSGKDFMICSNCAIKDKCFYCLLPLPTKTLNDGRKICQSCDNSAPKSDHEIRAIFKDIRNDLAKMYNYDNRHNIGLKIVDNHILQKVSASIYMPEGGKQLALMNYQAEIATTKRNGKTQEHITKEICTIYVLKNTPKERLIDALAHELTHDHIRHNVGEVKELANEEGFCELVAALYNKAKGQEYLNNHKTTNPDPVYGDGFRKMWKIYQNNKSFEKTLKYVK